MTDKLLMVCMCTFILMLAVSLAFFCGMCVFDALGITDIGATFFMGM